MDQEDHDQRLKSAVKSQFRDVIDLMLPQWLGLFCFDDKAPRARSDKPSERALALRERLFGLDDSYS